MHLIIKQLSEEEALKVSFWQYAPAYDWYNSEDYEVALDEFLQENYYVGMDELGRLIGFYCFRTSAQVSRGKKLGFYDDPTYLDMGLGMNPLFCGQGRGGEFLKEGMAFATRTFGVKKFRLTVATVNKRAKRTYEKVGYVTVGSFVRGFGSRQTLFDVMVYEKEVCD